jgi:hypothetical protein
LPQDLIMKGSVALGASNPVSLRLLEVQGLNTVNIPGDTSLAALRQARAAIAIPLDLYVESP